MKIRSIWYCLGQGIKNLGRNRIFSLASIATMTLCIFMVGLFYSITTNVSYNVNNMADKLYIKVFFDYDITDERIESIGNTIRMHSNVVSTHFTSAEEAWEIYKDNYFGEEYKEFADAYQNDNPLINSASYEVYFKDAASQKTLVDYIKAIDGVRTVNSYENSADGLTEIGGLVSVFSIVIVGLLIAVALFLISNTIAMGITVRSDEISIMRLLGARNGFIRAPFVVEGIILGTVGAILPLGIMYLLYDNIVNSVLSNYSFIGTILTFKPVNEIYMLYVPVAIGLGVGLGLIGSIISLSRHLRT